MIATSNLDIGNDFNKTFPNLSICIETIRLTIGYYSFLNKIDISYM